MAIKGVRDKNDYRLEVPLDASGIKDIKPDSAIKVAAYPVKGPGQEKIAKFDKSGKSEVDFSYEVFPGRLLIVLGPETATTEELRALQTIAFEVLPQQWQGKKVLRLKPILIPLFYWKWWWRWCRNFKITGKVVCPNGTDPVPGATVCAFDVDWWWWWWSKHPVGCATTAADGTFEIDFKHCCGWWPWWWWEHRIWQLNPHLLDRILALLRQDPRFVKLPIPSHNPSLDIFQQLLQWSAAGGRSMQPAPPLLRGAKAASGSTFDPASLDSLREQLLKALPPAPEFAQLKLWPWYPWYPWWDCDADIIFRVTQNCPGKESVIVNETIWDTHWDISTDFDVTLTANDQACCTGTNCTDNSCHEGICLLPTDICSSNVSFIGGNEGAISASPVGMLNPGLALQPCGSCEPWTIYSCYADRPFAGSVPIYGVFGDKSDVDYYEFMMYYAGDGTPGNGVAAYPDPVVPPSPLPVPPIPSSSYSPLLTPAFGGFDRLHLVFTPTPHWSYVPFHVQTMSDGATDHYVIESRAHYEKVNGTQLWDSGSFDLLGVFNSENLADGTYYLQVRCWKLSSSGFLTPYPAATIGDPNPILPICGTEDPNATPPETPTPNYWVVTINNQLATLGPTDINGLPCGAGTVHLCTGQPETAILQVQIQHEDGTTIPIGPCDNVCIVKTDQVLIDFVAYDPDGYLAYYTLDVVYGASQINDLLHLASSNLAASPLVPSWTYAAAQRGPDYGHALSQGATSPWWKGGAIRLSANAMEAFPETCAYDLQLYAYKRTITCDDYSFWSQHNISEWSFTIVNPCVDPCPPPVVAPVDGLTIKPKPL
jgi:hypothetical protein